MCCTKPEVSVSGRNRGWIEVQADLGRTAGEAVPRARRRACECERCAPSLAGLKDLSGQRRPEWPITKHSRLAGITYGDTCARSMAGHLLPKLVEPRRVAEDPERFVAKELIQDQGAEGHVCSSTRALHNSREACEFCTSPAESSTRTPTAQQCWWVTGQVPVWELLKHDTDRQRLTSYPAKASTMREDGQDGSGSSLGRVVHLPPDTGRVCEFGTDVITITITIAIIIIIIIIITTATIPAQNKGSSAGGASNRGHGLPPDKVILKGDIISLYYPANQKRSVQARTTDTAEHRHGEEEFLKVSYLFQSFTEGKVQRVIGTLVERQGVSASRRGRRTRRARKEPRACSLHEVQLTVTELGLGYDSDETVSFRYCSGWCDGRRRNYDLVMEHVRLGEASRRRARRRGRAKAEPAHHGPCCRPIKYEKKMSFFDNNERFFTIKNVSAKECGCV
ncbi:hypothetical protein P4O66_002390 [Electrophorus voltai]|uniref:TGF-beta family profile domain-containing protein n=1 Tax=Electrophorus voltai TaxID=2609070 RepID=A0AAD9DRI6_9TELE|nr:hypothetical protein P4O66_002390 [Electrophorus voltai]